MNDGTIIFWFAILCAGLAGSAIFSGLEIGFYTVNRVRLAIRAARGDSDALRLRRQIQNAPRTLSVLLIANNTANYVATFGAAEVLYRLGLTDWNLIVFQAVVFTPVVFVVGEVLPKDLFRTHTDHWTFRLSWVLLAVRWLFTVIPILPIVQVFALVISRLLGGDERSALTARQRISLLIKEGVGAGLLTEQQMTLADRALSMKDRTVATEIISWRQVQWTPLDASPAERRDLIRGVNFTRLPVVDRSGRVVGVLNTLDALLEADRPTAEIMFPPFELAPKTSVIDALKSMRAADRNMAIIVDPASGKPQGIVTLKDLVEPLTGELGAW